jgi:hypothetical protein
MLRSKDLPANLLAEAAVTACKVLNMSWNKRIKKSPFEAWTRQTPDIAHLKIFASEAYALLQDHKRKKWNKRSENMILIGFDENKATILDVGKPPFLIAIDRAHLPEHFHNYNSYPETNSFRDIRIFFHCS